ncbi:FAD binding domain [Ruegeria marina]|uniref:FAD binding domain n=2 Tax=Ruegeria marina TaxID=639004 RepID=A0A1G6PA43_9RHOB|nr:FAD binding domain [Ruegeria marina]
MLWAGPKCHIVHDPFQGWRSFNLVVTYHNDAPEPVAGKPVGAGQIRKGFEHVSPMARQIIDKERDWKLWGLCDRDPIMTCPESRMALQGDAAHPMLQYFAQGACMAMEDAVCLSALVGDGGDIPEILTAYQKKRRLRTARVQLQSRKIGEHIYHPDGAHAALRNALMSAKTPEQWYDTVEWLYGGTGLMGV